MKPDIILSRQVNYVIEGFYLLWSVADAEKEKKHYDFREKQNRLLRKDGTRVEWTEKITALEEKLTARAAEVLKDDLPRIQKFFTYSEGLSSVTASMIICMNLSSTGGNSHDSGAGILKDYHDLTEWERDKCFLHDIYDTDKEEICQIIGTKEDVLQTDAVRIKNILSYIQNLDIGTEQKMMLQDAYLNRDSYVIEVADLFDKAIAILKEQEAAIAEITEEWEKEWRIWKDSEEIQAAVENALENAGQKELVMVPGLMRGAWIQTIVEASGAPYRGVPVLWRIGVHLTKEMVLESIGDGGEERYSPEECQQILKLVGDKSKFDILLFIKERPAYGTEIARQLGLTTATVSHHMNQLQSYGLVDFEIREKRVYYKTRKKEVQNIFEECKRVFQ